MNTNFIYMFYENSDIGVIKYFEAVIIHAFV